MPVQCIPVLSNENGEMDFPVSLIHYSATLTSTVENLGINFEDPDLGSIERIELSNCNNFCLEKTIKFYKFYEAHPPPHKDATDDEKKIHTKIITEFNAQFCKEVAEFNFVMIMTADYLDTSIMFTVLCEDVAEAIKGKTTEQLREMYDIEDDFTEEDLAKLYQSRIGRLQRAQVAVECEAELAIVSRKKCTNVHEPEPFKLEKAGIQVTESISPSMSAKVNAERAESLTLQSEKRADQSYYCSKSEKGNTETAEATTPESSYNQVIQIIPGIGFFSDSSSSENESTDEQPRLNVQVLANRKNRSNINSSTALPMPFSAFNKIAIQKLSDSEEDEEPTRIFKRSSRINLAESRHPSGDSNQKAGNLGPIVSLKSSKRLPGIILRSAQVSKKMPNRSSSDNKTEKPLTSDKIAKPASPVSTTQGASRITVSTPTFLNATDKAKESNDAADSVKNTASSGADCVKKMSNSTASFCNDISSSAAKIGSMEQTEDATSSLQSPFGSSRKRKADASETFPAKLRKDTNSLGTEETQIESTEEPLQTNASVQRVANKLVIPSINQSISKIAEDAIHPKIDSASLVENANSNVVITGPSKRKVSNEAQQVISDGNDIRQKILEIIAQKKLLNPKPRDTGLGNIDLSKNLAQVNGTLISVCKKNPPIINRSVSLLPADRTNDVLNKENQLESIVKGNSELGDVVDKMDQVNSLSETKKYMFEESNLSDDAADNSKKDITYHNNKPNISETASYKEYFINKLCENNQSLVTITNKIAEILKFTDVTISSFPLDPVAIARDVKQIINELGITQKDFGICVAHVKKSSFSNMLIKPPLRWKEMNNANRISFTQMFLFLTSKEAISYFNDTCPLSSKGRKMIPSVYPAERFLAQKPVNFKLDNYPPVEIADPELCNKTKRVSLEWDKIVNKRGCEYSANTRDVPRLPLLKNNSFRSNLDIVPPRSMPTPPIEVEKIRRDIIKLLGENGVDEKEFGRKFCDINDDSFHDWLHSPLDYHLYTTNFNMLYGRLKNYMENEILISKLRTHGISGVPENKDQELVFSPPPRRVEILPSINTFDLARNLISLFEHHDAPTEDFYVHYLETPQNIIEQLLVRPILWDDCNISQKNIYTKLNKFFVNKNLLKTYLSDYASDQ
uniref:INCENP_ARK-bind domain-containing protein n=1 Tax=Rhabditophanes sp. KR3021 TaxID=114890 RepID=A0AC35U7B4_9BILA